MLQAVALSIGRLAVVQPVLVSSVVFALPLGAKLTGQRVHRIDVVAALMVTAALIAFLVIPTLGRPGRRAVSRVADHRRRSRRRRAPHVHRRLRPSAKAATLGTAAGILFALTAALTKVTADQFDEGVFEIFVHWHLYALIVVGYISMTLNQLALGTGVLAPAIATSIATDPIVASSLAPRCSTSPCTRRRSACVGTVISLLVALGAIAVLARSQEGGAATKPGSGTVAPPQQAAVDRHLESRPQGA